MNPVEEQLRAQLAEAEAKCNQFRLETIAAEKAVIDTQRRAARMYAAAAKIIKPFADMRALCGENEREAIMARMVGGVDYAWEDRRVCLEVRHLSDAYNWIKENGNG